MFYREQHTQDEEQPEEIKLEKEEPEEELEDLDLAEE